MIGRPLLCFFFFFNDTATTEIYTLSLHDALPIYQGNRSVHQWVKLNPNEVNIFENGFLAEFKLADRKSTRLNSSHLVISYAVFCLKKKKKRNHHRCPPQLPKTPDTPRHITLRSRR